MAAEVKGRCERSSLEAAWLEVGWEFHRWLLLVAVHGGWTESPFRKISNLANIGVDWHEYISATISEPGSKVYSFYFIVIYLLSCLMAMLCCCLASCCCWNASCCSRRYCSSVQASTSSCCCWCWSKLNSEFKREDANWLVLEPTFCSSTTHLSAFFRRLANNSPPVQVGSNQKQCHFLYNIYFQKSSLE